MNEHGNWGPFQGRGTGSDLDQAIAKALSQQGVEQHERYPGRLRRRADGALTEVRIVTDEPAEATKSWDVYVVKRKDDGTTAYSDKIAEVRTSHETAVLAAAHNLAETAGQPAEFA